MRIWSYVGCCRCCCYRVVVRIEMNDSGHHAATFEYFFYRNYLHSSKALLYVEIHVEGLKSIHMITGIMHDIYVRCKHVGSSQAIFSNWYFVMQRILETATLFSNEHFWHFHRRRCRRWQNEGKLVTYIPNSWRKPAESVRSFLWN